MTMNAAKSPFTVTMFLAAALLSAAILSLSAPAYSQATGMVVRIHSDGSVDPSSVPIQRSGDTYVFTGDLTVQGIVIEKEGITLDGEGHTLTGSYNGEQTSWIIGEGPNQTVNNTEIWSIGIDTATNTIGHLTIKNINIMNFSIGMYPWTPNNTITGNAITNCIVGILVAGDNNTITNNYLADNKNGVFFGSNNQAGNLPANLVISGNTFVDNVQQLGGCLCGDDYNTTEPIHTWDNGKEGNFWSDYTGADNNGDGLGDTPYVIDPLNMDRYPLIASSVSPPKVTTGLPLDLLVGAAVLVAVAVSIGVVLRQKNRKQKATK
jgi:nitrous oxidase accessory protein NosD